MSTFSNDTICALATANGVGAIAVIRISGPDTFDLLSGSFSKELKTASSHTLHFGNFKDKDGKVIDEVLVSVFHEGKSYTGEKSAEISCHASPFIQERILKTLLSKGARLANSGEYTQRAFLNGKLDLSQAEAVADLIASNSKSAHDIAMNQLKGGFSSQLKEVREKLIHFASLVELELDFSEEDVEFADRTELFQLVNDVLAFLRRLTKSFELGNAIKNGVPVAIVGAPNTGKSTLLNQLLGEDRAIVSDIAGTTRDVIEEVLNIDGILFRLFDTAGIREEAGEIEAMGIERSKKKIEQAKVVLCMADVSDAQSRVDVPVWASEIAKLHSDKKVVLIGNKTDKSQNKFEKCDLDMVYLSAKEGTGIEDLKNILVKCVVQDFDSGNETIISNVRHYDALLKTIEELEKAHFAIERNITGDFIAMDIRQAMFHLGSITGDISTDDLLGNIFSKFCIGK